MLYRKIQALIEEHLQSESRRILLIDGARQVGKTYIIRHVGNKLFENYIEINMVEDFLGPKLFAETKTVEDFYLQVSMLEGSKMKQKENNRLIGIASGYEDCVYIEISNVAGGNLLAYHIGEYVGVIEPSLHSGMFQDSILYLKYATEDVPCSLDFRYWPMGWGDALETYSWSDNIKQAVIKNETGYELRFNHTTIPVGETMIFTSECHRQGLISPDCHNGKFSDIL